MLLTVAFSRTAQRLARTGPSPFTIRPRGMKHRRPIRPPTARRSANRMDGALRTPFSVRRARPIAAGALVALGVSAVALAIYATLVRVPAKGKQSARVANSEALVSAPVSAPVYSAVVVNEYDHDLNAFTQGLLWHDGFLYESTGLLGKSSLRKVDVETGQPVLRHNLLDADFGEGIALCGANGEDIVQVLWKTGKGYIYSRESLEQTSEFTLEGDAWGLASAPGSEDLFLSDGSSRIRVMRRQGDGIVQVREFLVYDGDREVGMLNELEVIDGQLWANVWMSDLVARIDVDTGAVASWLDLTGILNKDAVPHGHETDVLNGIAYDATTGRIFVTGKMWPKMFSVRVSKKRVADSVENLDVSTFFMDPKQVQYVHKSILA